MKGASKGILKGVVKWFVFYPGTLLPHRWGIGFPTGTYL